MRTPSLRPWSMLLGLVLAGLLGAAIAPHPAAAQADVAGQWQTMSTTAVINPIHVAVLRSGKVLLASGSENDPSHTTFRAALWDPGTGAFTLQSIPWDLFCNAMTALPDGRMLITGGNAQYNPFRGLRNTTIFDPTTERFIRVQDMAHGRWYPSNALLADGTTMTFSGWLESAGVPNQSVEIYTVATGWSPEFQAGWTPSLYPWMHLLPNGKVFVSGAKPTAFIFDPATKTWTQSATTIFGQLRQYGSSVLLPLRPASGYRPRVMIMGGSPAGSTPATATVEMIDLGAAAPAWQSLPPMSAGRIEMNSVLLPTGKVLALGGSVIDNDPTTASLNADLFDPATSTWSSAGTAAIPRLYHSVALLLPDATVWVAGSNPFQGSWDNRMEIYRPAYLFTRNSSGAVVAATRPSITSVPSTIGYSGAGAPTFQVQTPDAANIGSVVLVRPGSATHGFNFDQRVVELSFTAGTGVLNVTPPPNTNIAPPGYYMVFILSRTGVPSVAKFVQVMPSPANRPPNGTIVSPAATVTINAGQSVTFAGEALDPDGTVTKALWSFPGGTPDRSTVLNPGAVTFSTPGTYVASLTVTDNLGANDPSPPTVTVMVQSPTFAASITSPANGATVNGTQTVAMSVAGASTPPYTYTLAVDGGQVFTTSSSSTTASFAWNTATVSDGSHTLTLTARDASGQAATASSTVTVSNAVGAITVAITSPTNGATVSGTNWVDVWVNNVAGPYNYTLTVGGTTVATTSSSAVHVTLPWDTTRVANGPQKLTATVQTSTRTGSTSVDITVNNAGAPPPPSPSLAASFTSPAAGATVAGTTMVGMSSSNAAAGNITYKLAIDGAVVSIQTTTAATVSYAWNTTTYADGAHTLALTVTDSGGATATASRSVTVANTAPSTLGVAVTSPQPNETVSGNYAVNVWVGTPAGTPPYTYTVTVAGATVATTTSSATHVTLGWATTGTPDGPQTLTATVRDSAGNTGRVNVPVTVRNGTTAPPPSPALTASFTSPAAGATIAATTTVGMAAGGGTAPYTYTLAIDGVQKFTTTTSATSASYAWDTTTATNAAHTLQLTVRDSAAATATATRTVTVSNGSAGTITVAMTSPTNGETVSGTYWVNVWVGTPAGTPPYSYTLTSAGATVWSATSSDVHVTLPWVTTSTPDGPQTLTATVRDAVGKTGTTSVNVTVANGASAPPPAALSASITSPTEGATVGGSAVSVAMAASGGKPPYTYTLQVDGAAAIFTTTTSATTASFAWNTTSYANGPHTLRLTVTDSASATASATRGVTVSNTSGGTPLVVALTSPTSGEIVSGTNWANIWVDVPAGTPPYTYTLSVGTTVLFQQASSDVHVTLPWDTTRVANGARTLKATVTDSAGRTGSTTVNVTVQNP